MTLDVSVVIPTRNRRQLLARTLDSVLAQDAVALEVIVVDEGSTDDTAEYLAGLADDRMRVIHHDTPQGVAAARNAGIERCRAGWVAFTDDDDVWAPVKLKAQLEQLEATPGAGWACTGAVMVDEHLRLVRPQMLPPGDAADLLLAGNVVPGGASSVVARTEVLHAIGGFDRTLSNFADWDMWIRLALHSPLASIDRPLVGYLLHAGGMAHHVARAEAELVAMEAKHRVARAERQVAFGWAGLHLYFGEMHLRAGRRLPAAAAHARLLRHHRADLRASLGGRSRMRWAGVAGVGLVWPGVQRLIDRHAGRMPKAWQAEAEAWLTPLRAQAATMSR